MKKFRHFFRRLCALCASAAVGAALLTPAWAAASDAQGGFSEQVQAADAVDRAAALGLIPPAAGDGGLPARMDAPISRGAFFACLIRFIAAQQRCDAVSFSQMVCYDWAERAAGEAAPAFPDASAEDLGVAALSLLGVVRGRGDGEADLEAGVTRQEAAALLARTYQAYGGAPFSGLPASRFADEAAIAPWARESVEAMCALGVMEGQADGRFAPDDLCSCEECLVSLVRLYETGPISQKNGTVAPLFSYRQYIAMLEAREEQARKNKTGLWETLRVVSRYATFSRLEPCAPEEDALSFLFIDSSGAMRSVPGLGLCDTGLGYCSKTLQLLSPRFSEDGTTFLCAVRLDRAVPSRSPACPGHEAGTYQVAIDVRTCRAQAVRLGD